MPVLSPTTLVATLWASIHAVAEKAADMVKEDAAGIKAVASGLGGLIFRRYWTK